MDGFAAFWCGFGSAWGITADGMRVGAHERPWDRPESYYVGSRNAALKWLSRH
jgi:hypothetical protein